MSLSDGLRGEEEAANEGRKEVSSLARVKNEGSKYGRQLASGRNSGEGTHCPAGRAGRAVPLAVILRERKKGKEKGRREGDGGCEQGGGKLERLQVGGTDPDGVIPHVDLLDSTAAKGRVSLL